MKKIKSLATSHWLLIIVILIIAIFFRLYNITQLPPGLYHDEAMNGNNALETLSTREFSAFGGPASGWKVFYSENNGREGLFINIQAFFLWLFGVNEPWVLRLPSAIFGILTVLGTYLLTKQLFNNKIALLSSFLLATSFWHINFSRIGFRAIMAPAFLVWGLFLLLKSLNQTKNNFQFSIFNFQFLAILAGLFYGLGFYSYIAYRATLLLILIVLFLYWLKAGRETPKDSNITSEPTRQADAKLNSKLTRKKVLLVACLFSFVALIIAAPLGLYFLENPQDFFGRTTQISIFASPTLLKDLGLNILKTAGMFNFIGDWNWRHNYAGRPELFWPVGILFLIGVFLAVKSLIQNSPPKADPPLAEKFKIQNYNSKFKSDINDIPPQADTEILPFAFCILISWLIVAALPVIISNEGMPHALRSILMAPPVFILASIGGLCIYELVNNAMTRHSIIWMFKVFVFVFFSILVFEAYNTYFIKWGKNPHTAGAFNADYVQIGRELNSLPAELSKYVVVEAGGIDVRGIPMPAQTVMFVTDTFTSEKQKEKNIYYLLPDQRDQIPENSYVAVLK